MSVLRVVPNLQSPETLPTEQLLVEVLGFEKQMDLGWVKTFASTLNPSAQLTILNADPSGLHPDITVEVTDVDEMHGRVVEAGFSVVYGPTDEPWQVRRSFVRLPDGHLLNIMSHPGV